jgi:hypothetical protein
MLFLLAYGWVFRVRLVHQAPQLHCRTQDALGAVHPVAQMGGGLIRYKRTPNASCYAKGGLGTSSVSCYAHGGLVCSKRIPSASCYANGGLDTQLNAHQARTKCTPSASCYAHGGLMYAHTKCILLCKWGASHMRAHQVDTKCILLCTGGGLDWTNVHQMHPAMHTGGLCTASAYQVHPAMQTGDWTHN